MLNAVTALVLGATLLGMIIQRVTGESPAAQVERRILRPLGLSGTSFPVTATTLPAPAADGYLPAAGGAPADVTAWNPSAGGAAGAMISTVADLARFYRALLGRALLPPAQLAQMLAPVDAGGFGYGLGLIEVQTPGGLAVGHNGLVFGYATDVCSTLDGSRQMVLSSNMDSVAGLAGAGVGDSGPALRVAPAGRAGPGAWRSPGRLTAG